MIDWRRNVAYWQSGQRSRLARFGYDMHAPERALKQLVAPPIVKFRTVFGSVRQMEKRKPKRSLKMSVFDAVQTPAERRIEALSDGVFAVGMTLLVLDIKLPTMPNEISSHEFIHAIFALWPHFGVFVLSFVILARAWAVHHYIFDYLVRYDHTLVYLNMLYLMAVALLPFSTSLVGTHSNFEISAAIYAANFLALSGITLLIWNYATRDRRLVRGDIQPELIAWLKKRLVLSTVINCAAILIALISPPLCILLLLIYQLSMVIIPFLRKNSSVAE